MKRVSRILLLMVVVCSTRTSFAQLVTDGRYFLQNPKNVKNFLDIDFVDSTNGVVLYKNGVMRTTDGGVTWKDYPATDTVTINGSISMGSKTLVIRACGDDKSLQHSTDGGITWTKKNVTVPTGGIAGGAPYNVSMYDDVFGVAVGNISLVNGEDPTGAIYYTADGGNTWSKSITGSGVKSPLVKVSMGSSTKAVAIAASINSSVVGAVSLNGGNRWSASTSSAIPTGLSVSVQMMNDTIGYMTAVYAPPKLASAPYFLWTSNGGVTWDIRGAGLSNVVSKAISFKTSSTGVLLVNSGGGVNTLYVTDDSGKTWTPKNLPSLPSDNLYRDVEYLSNDVIIVAGDNSTLLRSTNRGDSWVSYALGNYTGLISANNTLRGIVVNKRGVGLAVGGGIVRTTDKGNEWRNVTTITGDFSLSTLINKVAFASDSIVVAVADSGKYLRSTDAGVSWIAANIGFGGNNPVLSVDFLNNSGFGVAVGSSGKFARTFDYGQTWKLLSSTTSRNLYSAIIRDFERITIYMSGDSGTVLFSIDSGLHWQNKSGLPNNVLPVNNIDAVDSSYLYVLSREVSAWPGVFRLTKNSGSWSEIFSYSTSGFTNLGSTLVKAATPSFIIASMSGEKAPSWTNESRIALSKNKTDPWVIEKFLQVKVNDIYISSPTDVYFASGGYQIWRRVQADYPDLPNVLNVKAKPSKPTQKSIVVVNTGADTLFTAITKKGTSTPLAIVSSTSLLVPPGGTDSIVIRFSPTAVGTFYDTLLISSNALSFRYDTVVLVGYSSGKPAVDFSASTTTVCAGDTVKFTGVTDETPLSWNWTFTGGSPGTSKEQNPKVVYTTPGTYDVTLKIIGADGDSTTTKQLFITVNAAPTSKIDVGVSTSCSTPLSANSSTAGSGTIKGFQWYLNGVAITGAISSTYDAGRGGSYRVEVTNSNGCSTLSDSVHVDEGGKPSAFVSGDTVSCDGDTVKLSSALSIAGKGSITGRQWMKDGTVIPNATSKEYHVRSNGSGVYRVIITNNAGCVDTSIAHPVIFSSRPIVHLGNDITTCDSVTLNAGSGAHYLWSTGETAQKITVSKTGDYSVTVTNAAGCSGTDTIHVSYNGLSASITAPDTAIVNKDISFHSNSGSATSWHWKFGDGNSGTEGTCYQADTVYRYSAVGTYIVTLIVSNGVCSDTIKKTIVVVKSSDVKEELSHEVGVLNVYPNPNSGKFILDIDLQSFGSSRIRITNVLGVIVYEEKVSDVSSLKREVDLHNYSQGMYHVQIETAKGKIVKKIFIQ